MLMVVEPEREEPGCNFTLFYAGWGEVGTEVAVGEWESTDVSMLCRARRPALSLSLSLPVLFPGDRVSHRIQSEAGAPVIFLLLPLTAAHCTGFRWVLGFELRPSCVFTH